MVLVEDVVPIGDQAATADEIAGGVDRGELVPGRKREDQLAMEKRQCARRHDQTTVRGPREGGDGALDLSGVTYVDRTYVYASMRPIFVNFLLVDRR